jgi:ribonucleases P/MRP protein subunit RPP40
VTLLFLIYINDLDIDIISKISKFADDSKLCRAVSNETDRNILRLDLDKIYNWSETWQMNFNIDKCTVVHLGSSNKQFDYNLGNNLIKSSTAEKDLGVVIDSSGKSSEQCRVAASSANRLLGFIKRNIKFKSKDIVIRLYKALVRPKLEYCVQAWCPYLKKDIAVLERVQKRATKMIMGLHNLSYYDRLIECSLLPLEKRRLRGDLIQTFKFMKGFDRVDYNKFFTLNSTNRTRGHSLKLGKSRSRLDIRRNFFSQRVVDSWNRLPQNVIDATSVNSFKNNLDKCHF